jgi:hypothetical protein
MQASLVGGDTDLDVVGESKYQKNLWRLVGARSRREERVLQDIVAVLVADQNNPADINAISIWIDGLKVGCLSRDDARQHRAGLLALQDKFGKPVALSGVIAGGGSWDDGQGLLSVFLRYDPKEFGLRAPPMEA